MSRRSRIVILATLALLAIAAEVYSRRLNANRASVLILNETGAPLRGLVVSFGDDRTMLGDLPAGGSTRARLGGASQGTLLIDYRQEGNPVQGFRIDEFDPAYLSREGFKMVLTLEPQQIVRALEDDADSSTPRSLGSRLYRWIEADLGAMR